MSAASAVLAVVVDARVDDVVPRRQARIQVGVEDRGVRRTLVDRRLLRGVDGLRRRARLADRAELDREPVGARTATRSSPSSASSGRRRRTRVPVLSVEVVAALPDLHDRSGRRLVVGVAAADQHADQQHPAEQRDPDHRGERRDVGRARRCCWRLRRPARRPAARSARAARRGGCRRPGSSAGRAPSERRSWRTWRSRPAVALQARTAGRRGAITRYSTDSGPGCSAGRVRR